MTCLDIALIKNSSFNSSHACTVNKFFVILIIDTMINYLFSIVPAMSSVGCPIALTLVANELLLLLLMILLEVRIEAVSSVVKAAVLARREIYRCRIVHSLGCISAAPMHILLLLNLLLPNRISNIVWVKKDQFLVIVGDG